MGHNLKLTDQGIAKFYEGIAGGTSYVGLKAASTLAATFNVTLPNALPGSTLFLTMTTGGVIGFSAGTGSLQSAYDGGQTITLTSFVIVLSQANDAGVLQIDKTGAGVGIVADFENDGTGKLLYLKQDGAVASGAALHLDVTVNQTVPCFLIDKTASGGGVLLSLNNDGTGVSLNIDNSANAIGINLVNAGTSAGIAIANSANAHGVTVTKTGAGAGDCLNINNQGTGRGLFIDQTAQNGNCARLDSNRNFTVLQITKSGSGAGTGITITDSGTGASINLTKGGNGIGLEIDKTATGAGACLDIDNDGTGQGILIAQDGIANAIQINQNAAATALSITQAAAARGAVIFKSNAGAGIVLEIEDDGTGGCLSLNQDGNQIPLVIDAGAAVTGAAISITHNGADDARDISGTGANWSITRNGDFVGGRFSWGQSNLTIAAGVVTISEGGFLVIDTEAAAASDDLDTITSTSADPLRAGTVVIVKAANDARTVVVKDGTGNITLSSSADWNLDSSDDTLMLVYTGAVWLQVGGSNNSA